MVAVSQLLSRLEHSILVLSTFTFLALREDRLVGLLLFVFIDPLQDAVHLLLEEELELLNHELVDGASLDEVGDEALHGVAFVDDDALDAEVSHVDIHVQLGFSVISLLTWVFLWGVFIGVLGVDGRSCRLVA